MENKTQNQRVFNTAQYRLLKKQLLIEMRSHPFEDFPGGSGGEESACNTGDLGSTRGLGSSLVKGMTTHPSIQVGEFPGQRSLVGYSPWGSQSQT